MRRLLFCAMLLLSANTIAHDYQNENIKVDHPWARPTFALATTGAVYLSLENLTKESKTLLSASVSEDIASTAELHDVLMDGDVMKMREQTAGVEIPAGDAIDFSPGGKHIMLLGLKGPLQEGDSFGLTLHFNDNSSIDVVVYVEQPDNKDSNTSHHH